MYWRDYYPNHASAERAATLGDLGKIKLTATQKAAIQSARADAKVAAVQAKANLKAAKLANKLTLVNTKAANKVAVANAAAQAKIAKSNAAGATATNSVIPVTSPESAALTLPDMGGAALPFAQSGGGGGGGGGAMTPADQSASAVTDGTVLGLPLPVVLGAAALVLLLLFTKK